MRRGGGDTTSGIISADQTMGRGTGKKKSGCGKGNGDPDLRACMYEGEKDERWNVLSKYTRMSIAPTFVGGRHKDSQLGGCGGGGPNPRNS